MGPISLSFPSAPPLARVATPPGGRRAAVAVVFARCSATCEVRVLFQKRAVNERDPWSGDVSFPGGKQDEQDRGDDEATAMREVLEEVGIDLAGRSWCKLGRLADDRVVRRGQRQLIVATYGFIVDVIPPAPLPQTKICEGEVDYAWWVPLTHLCQERVEWHRLPSKVYPFPRLLRPLIPNEVKFGCVQLPPPAGAPPNLAVPLWGLTLSLLSDVLRRAGRPPLVGPGAPARYSHQYGVAGETAGDLLVRSLLYMNRQMKTIRQAAMTVALVAIGVALLRLL
jgi:8-oxo-dGTP pyrophosphatase MutT (NUDIX family)